MHSEGQVHIDVVLGAPIEPAGLERITGCFFWMPIGTDIFVYSKVLEAMILRHFGKMIRVWN